MSSRSIFLISLLLLGSQNAEANILDSAKGKIAGAFQKVEKGVKDKVSGLVPKSVKKANTMKVGYNISPTKSGLRVMSFNIRFRHGEKNAQNNWENRLHLVLRLIRDFKPDIVGFQEMLDTQLPGIISGLKKLGLEYKSFGKGRLKAGALNERNTIMYLKKSVKLLDHHTVGLNDQRKIGVKVKGSQHARVVSYGHFKAYGKNIVLFNTHLSLEYKPQMQQAVIITDIIKEYLKDPKRKKASLLLMGDFNASPTSRTIQTTLSELESIDLKNTGAGIESFHGFGAYKSGGSTIDYIFHAGPENVVKRGTIQMHGDKTPELLPSDHRPVFVDLK